MIANLKQLILSAAATAVLLAGGSIAAAQDGPPPPPDRHHRPGWDEPHAPPPPPPPPGARIRDRDRYWQPRYHGYVPHDRVYGALRGHGYRRWDGDPYWYRGHYVVHTYDRRGRAVFVEVNPYTADFIGVIKF
jgi:hypothetical protein